MPDSEPRPDPRKRVLPTVVAGLAAAAGAVGSQAAADAPGVVEGIGIDEAEAVVASEGDAAPVAPPAVAPAPPEVDRVPILNAPVPVRRPPHPSGDQPLA